MYGAVTELWKLFNFPPGNISGFQIFLKIMQIMAFSFCKI
jgi:hypothetical protein